MTTRRLLGLTLIVLGALTLLLAARLEVRAQGGGNLASPMHPPVTLLDADGVSVLQSNAPISTAKTCGTCHDTAFIMANSAHSRADLGFGLERLYPAAAEQGDGGEMNCFLCHLANPNNTARLEALARDELVWANTATLIGSGLVERTETGYRYNADAFTNGAPSRDRLPIQDPSTANCGLCHGAADHQTVTPLLVSPCDINDFNTATTGQIFSPQRVSQSALNITNKAQTTRSFDIHAERLLKCTNCHYALNNPVYYQSHKADAPSHLQFDPRRMDFGEYLYRPLHQFAQGSNPQYGGLPSATENTMRRCEGCHDAAQGHSWLPYLERHMQVLACESCHIPQTFAPAFEMVDYTALTADGAPNQSCRGIADSEVSFFTGYQPLLLPRTEKDGTQKVAPYNLITTFYWAYGTAEKQAVPQSALQSVYLTAEGYAADVLVAFDADGDGALSTAELRIDTPEKAALIAAKLAALGFPNAEIMGEVQPFALSHGVTGGAWAIRECRTCHTDDSLMSRMLTLAAYTPNGVLPTYKGGNVALGGSLRHDSDGTLTYVPPQQADLYVFGHHRAEWADTLGMLAFLGVLGGVFTHGGLRFFMARLRAKQGIKAHPELKRVYMYSVYERGWHWLQTAAILLLLLSGLVIHRPDSFPILSFAAMVTIHNVLAVILVINAALALFYHLASGQIKQFLPEPKGFFNDAIKQALFYLRGIFKGAPHPMQKTPERKLNPLQQITYLGLLNVLLPLQIITGILMWGIRYFPETAARLGGLPFLAPFHTLIAWLFAAFIIAHVYLTTTGHAPLAGISAMINGWEAVEQAPQHSSD